MNNEVAAQPNNSSATATDSPSPPAATTTYGRESANISPGVATQQISTRWLRHTLTWVERHHGYAVARAFAGHTGKNDAGTTTTYITADLHEIATALAALTSEPHPLAEPRT